MEKGFDVRDYAAGVVGILGPALKQAGVLCTQGVQCAVAGHHQARELLLRHDFAKVHHATRWRVVGLVRVLHFGGVKPINVQNLEVRQVHDIDAASVSVAWEIHEVHEVVCGDKEVVVPYVSPEGVTEGAVGT